jgi:hypothetical protein
MKHYAMKIYGGSRGNGGFVVFMGVTMKNAVFWDI